MLKWFFRLAAIAVAAVATFFILLVAHDEAEYRLGWYPDVSCYPPALDEAIVTAAFSFASQKVLGVTNARFQIATLSRGDDGDWPAFVGSIDLLDPQNQFWISGNGCGIEFERASDDLTINVSLPKVSLFSVRKGSGQLTYF